MRFKDLSQDDKNFLEEVYTRPMSHEERVEICASKFEISQRTVRLWWANLGLTYKKDTLPIQIIEARKRNLKNDTDVLLVTSVQNNTDINKAFWDNLNTYKKYLETTKGLNTEIVVIPTKYRNPTLLEEKESNINWNKAVNDHLFYGKLMFGDTLIAANARINPTAKEPLNGYEILANNKHLILGHSKIHYKVLPRLKSKKLITTCTTGYLSVKNYSESKAGQVAYENHAYGFVIVEKNMLPRNVKVKQDGSFMDLIYSVDKSGVEEIKNSLGFIWGDIHARHINKDVLAKTKEVAQRLNPDVNILHDVFDGSTTNPHESKDMFIQRLKISQGKHLIEDEVEECFSVIDEIKDCCNNVVVVESNHDNFLQRFIDSENWKRDLHNSPAYLKYAYIQQTVDLRDFGNIFGYLLHEKFKGGVRYLKMGESFELGGYEVGMHGDFGSNGSKGNAKSFNRLNMKIIHGHSHCLPGDYKVQTKDRGWVEIRNLSVGEIILSYDPHTMSNEWVPINEYIENYYDGLMIQIEGNGFEQTFTKDHMLMLKNGDYLKATEAIMTRSATELPLTANPVKDEGIDVPENIIKQIVAIASDGSFDGYRIRFHVKKDIKIKRLKELFGDDLVEHNSADGTFNAIVSTRSESYKNILEYKPHIKNISNEVLNWSTTSINILINELQHWDESYLPDNISNQYSTTNYQEVNCVMSCLNRLGYTCSLNTEESKSENNKIYYCITWTTDRDAIKDSNSMQHNKKFNGWGLSTYQSKEHVYCVSVKHKCFWVMSPKTGQVSLTGNSPVLMNNVTCVGVTCDLNQYYNRKGLSSWAYAHSVVHTNGKNQLLVFDDNLKISNLL